MGHVQAPREDRGVIPQPEPERIASLLSLAEQAAPEARIELYHRWTTRTRIAREAWSAGPLRFAGCEEGIAVRLADAVGRWTFGASSGGGSPSLLWAIEAARSSEPAGGGEEGPRAWGAGDGSFQLDLDEGPLPEEAAMEEWLDLALDALIRARGVAQRGPASGWIEAGRTVEVLVGQGGIATMRSRNRVWAMGSAGRERPLGALAVAARRISSLSADAWAEQWTASTASGGRGEWTRGPVVLEGRAAGELVRHLAAAVHGRGAAPGAPVGSGWRVVDDPLDPDGLSGGRFDDAGFPAGRRALSDGRQAVGALEGRGHSWRPSFRDPPEALFTTLLVLGGSEEAPPRTPRVHDLRIHRLAADRWVAEAPGPTYVEARPLDLVQRCVSSFGPVRRVLPGVVSPALLVDW